MLTLPERLSHGRLVTPIRPPGGLPRRRRGRGRSPPRPVVRIFRIFGGSLDPATGFRTTNHLFETSERTPPQVVLVTLFEGLYGRRTIRDTSAGPSVLGEAVATL